MNKITYLDGLRGIASFAVALDHLAGLCVGFFPHEIRIGPLCIFLFQHGHWGQISVFIFFVISGYVLSFSYFICPNYEKITEYAFKRYFRLAVPALFSILMAWALLKLGLMFNKDVGQPGEVRYNYIHSLFDIDADFFKALWQGVYGIFWNNDTAYNPALWTMSFELAGSLFIFFFLAVFGRYKRRWLIYIVSVVFFCIYQELYALFVFGVIIGDFYNSPFYENLRNKIQKNSIVIFMLFLFSFACTLGSYNLLNAVSCIFGKDLNSYSIRLWCHIFGAGLFVFVLPNCSFLKRLLNTPPFQFLGKISFSLYVVHMPLMASVSSYLLINFMNFEAADLRFAQAATMAVSVIVYLFFAYMVYLLVDCPSRKFSKLLYKIWQAP